MGSSSGEAFMNYDFNFIEKHLDGDNRDPESVRAAREALNRIRERERDYEERLKNVETTRSQTRISMSATLRERVILGALPPPAIFPTLTRQQLISPFGGRRSHGDGRKRARFGIPGNDD